MTEKYKIRAAQIDLNRQKEPMAFIKSYMDFIADNGYNTLMLYIAWRVKIKSHPYPSEEEAYTAAEIREMTAYGREKGLDVIPTTNLTYVTSLLKYDELRQFLENGSRYWGASRGNFCLSNPDIYVFIGNYLEELAELVPSGYFHIGGDEAWDTGFCKKCRGNDFNFQKEENLYLSFILACCDIVRKKLGRRVIMWDDMFEYYPDILTKIPNDVIMAHWQYQEDVSCSMGHFGNRKREYTLKKYDQLGFSYLISPATYSTANGRTFTEYAGDGKKLLGGIMTTWVTHMRFMYKVMPTIASIGRFWASDGQTAEADCFRQAMTDLLGSGDEILINSIRTCTENQMKNLGSFGEAYMLTFDLEGLDYSEYARQALVLSVLERYRLEIKPLPGQYIVEELILSLRFELAVFEIKRMIRNLLEKRSLQERPEDALAQLQARADDYAQKWQQWRPGIEPNHIQIKLNDFIDNMRNLLDKIASGNYLRILFNLPNVYGSMMTTLSLESNGMETIVAQGVFKGVSMKQPYFERFFLLDSDLAPSTLRIATHGYGGQGVCYAAAVIEGKTYGPEKVSASGKVVNPKFILNDDCTTCWMGEPDAEKVWRNRKLFDEISFLKVTMAESTEKSVG